MAKKKRKKAELKRFRIAKEHQNKGWGKYYLEHILENIKQAGIQEVILDFTEKSPIGPKISLFIKHLDLSFTKPLKINGELGFI